MIRWHVVENDEIGGFDVSIHDKPMSQHGRDESSIAWGLSEENAESIAEAMNVKDWVGKEFPAVLERWMVDNYGEDSE